MSRSYTTDQNQVPASWARALIVDGVPVAFILVDPDRQMEQPVGRIRYAFICDVAVREERRGEGHFRHMLEHTFSSLRVAGVPLVITHGRHQLYRRFGFDTFTHHCGVFVVVESIEKHLGVSAPKRAEGLLSIVQSDHIQDDLLLVEEVRATTQPESKQVLQYAAAVARAQGKERILFEHPPAPSYGSCYPIYHSLETPLAELAVSCGATVRIQRADPEAGLIPDADWCKVLDPVLLVERCVQTAGPVSPPDGAVCIDTEAGSVTIESHRGSVSVSGESRQAFPRVRWSSSALAQLVTGYAGVDCLALQHGTLIPPESMAVLSGLFPRRWRLSRNESWALKH